MNVLPMVNKALALYQGRNDVDGAEKFCRDALEVDGECEAAVATLAQLNIQQGKTEEAAQYLAKQVELARSEGELVSALSYQFVRVSLFLSPNPLLTLVVCPGIDGSAQILDHLPRDESAARIHGSECYGVKCSFSLYNFTRTSSIFDIPPPSLPLVDQPNKPLTLSNGCCPLIMCLLFA